MKKLTGPAKKEHVAKSALAEPVGVGSVPPQHEPPLKRGRGRPRKHPLNALGALNPAEIKAAFDANDAENDKIKGLITFRRALVDAEKLNMSASDYDGGGTTEGAPILSKESLQRRVARRLNVLDRFLTDDKLIELLAMSSLKEVGIYEAIMLDKSQVLSGQPNVIIGTDDRAKINDVLPRILNECKRRGLIATASERKIEFTVPHE